MSTILYRQYTGESDLPHIMALVQHELSEPYVIYTYRYFLHQWPHLSFLAYPEGSDEPIGVIVGKQSYHRDDKSRNRGYIAMLSVHRNWRKRGIASTLVRRSVERMRRGGAVEVVLETEFDNSAALSLYETLGFIREKRLYRFYLNGKDAFRLILVVTPLSSPSSADDNDNDSSTDGEADDALQVGARVAQPMAMTGKPMRLPILVPPVPIRFFPAIPYDSSDDEVSSR